MNTVDTFAKFQNFNFESRFINVIEYNHYLSTNYITYLLDRVQRNK